LDSASTREILWRTSWQRSCDDVFLKKYQAKEHKKYARNQEINKTVSEDQLPKTICAKYAWRPNANSEQLVHVQDDHQKIEAHRVNEDCSQDGVISFGNDAAGSRNPFSLHPDTLRGDLASLVLKFKVIIPCKIKVQWPKMTRTNKPTMYRL
jgi:hypothetical protein